MPLRTFRELVSCFEVWSMVKKKMPVQKNGKAKEKRPRYGDVDAAMLRDLEQKLGGLTEEAAGLAMAMESSGIEKLRSVDNRYAYADALITVKAFIESAKAAAGKQRFADTF
jgi:hypothetical protein